MNGSSSPNAALGSKMEGNGLIDVSFDFRTDTPPGRDPDSFSPTLRRYHKLLWSKALPGGQVFELSDARSRYLHHRSELGEFYMTSDAVVPTFRKDPRLAHVFEQIPDQLNSFMSIGYTIGGMMLFPGNRIGGRSTINAARGFHPRIKDRFDLTVECIRRHYAGAVSPLRDALARYAGFFRLFGDFRGYVDFFLLQDLVTPDYAKVKCFACSDDFGASPVPDGLDRYLAYRALAVEFIEARNRRIEEWAHGQASARTFALDPA